MKLNNVVDKDKMMTTEEKDSVLPDEENLPWLLSKDSKEREKNSLN